MEAMRATSSGGGLPGCAKEVMAAVTVEVDGKRRRQRPTMGGSDGWQLELAAAVVKKAGGWLRLGGRGWVALEGEETTAQDPTVGSGGGGDAGEERHD
ncbi:hypothetical protein BHM03_00055800 [Ensete ventricosum]|nr:hypothetical protein BHM03_00055800 [Ensete ventricosum]